MPKSSWEEHMKKQCTLRKISETGPSLSEATSSCLTFSNPLIIACISSAKDFNCIYIERKYEVNKNQGPFKQFLHAWMEGKGKFLRSNKENKILQEHRQRNSSMTKEQGEDWEAITCNVSFWSFSKVYTLLAQKLECI